ncbi:MAG: hypothetical protein ACRC1M_05690 [Methanobacteriaceae archaeon]
MDEAMDEINDILESIGITKFNYKMEIDKYDNYIISHSEYNAVISEDYELLEFTLEDG